MNTDTTDTDASTAENAGAPRDTSPPAPEPAVEQASGDQAAPAADPAPEPSEAPAGDQSDDQDDAEDQDDDAGGKGNKEAARYRRRLRDVEAERDTLKATVAALQRAEVDRLAVGADLRPAALWASGLELADVLGDDGTVDQGKVSTAIAAARETLGIPNPPPRGNVVKGEGRSLGRPPKRSGRDAMVAVVQGRDGSDG
ncbi:hypothetical protein [Mycobacterium kiyosense]|uniref:hypothetical protein n=1 Tax=Mycobacterium kiyosense TaxID=2871094 RepID=UPI00222E517C|nr:hypothetical protein [Mycobacterium kiyosense]GLC02571.1 hypothetical protein SRL2020400_31620 [Mycobacterium kiyosense]